MQPEDLQCPRALVGKADAALFPRPGPCPGVLVVEIGISTRRFEILLCGARRFGYGGVAAGEDGRDFLACDRLSRGERDPDVVTAAVAFPHDGVLCVGTGVVAPDGRARRDRDRDTRLRRFSPQYH